MNAAANGRVLHVLAPGEFGGLESVVVGLATAQRRSGMDVQVLLVVSPHSAPTPLARRLSAEGVEVHDVPVSPRGYIREFRRIRALCRHLAPAVVHTHGNRADVIAAAAARSAGVAVVSTVHGFTGGDWRMHMYEYLQSRALRRCQAVIAVSGPLRDRLEEEGLPRDRLYVVPNAFEPASVLPRAEARELLGLGDGFVAGWVGRLSSEKGPDVFVDALANLSPRVRLRAAIIGDGPMRTSLVDRAATLRLGDRLIWCGAVPEASRVLTAFDALVLSSRTEGTPMVLLEAMAAQVPIIATRVGGVAAMLNNTEAWLVPPENPAALADALKLVMKLPTAALRRARLAASRLRTQFGVARWTHEYERIYGDITESTPNRT